MHRKIKPTSRRGFLGQVVGATVFAAMSGLVVGRRAAAASDLPKLDPNDPQAKALNYVHKSSMEGQMCKDCQYFKGGDAAWGECQVFPGKQVNAQGWCVSFYPKGD